MRSLDQSPDEVKPINPDPRDPSKELDLRAGNPLPGCPQCHNWEYRGPRFCDQCKRTFFCAVCWWEVNHRFRVPIEGGRVVHERCVGKKPKVWR
jgi:hypothetical protein